MARLVLVDEGGAATSMDRTYAQTASGPRADGVVPAGRDDRPWPTALGPRKIAAKSEGNPIMGLTRRAWFRTALGAAAFAGPLRRGGAADRDALLERLDAVANDPVLRLDGLDEPVRIVSMELLRNRRNFVVRVRTTDGLEGIGVPNAMHLVHTYPIFLNRVAPFFVGKDARQLEPLLWELYRHDDNYKYQGLALWVCVAAAEFALLDLLASARANPSATCSAA